MGQVKAKTIIEKAGFKDFDKGSPKHDEIQLWTYENAAKIIDELFIKQKYNFRIMERKWEHEIIEEVHYYASNKKMVVGFVDLFVSFLRDIDKEENIWPCVYFEVKTEIPSLGELLRQLNFYKVYLKSKPTFVIVSPDERFEKVIQEQGFYFYKYVEPDKLF